MPRTRPTRPERTLVVLGGLPGAGKTTLLRRLALPGTVRALDAEDVAGVLDRLPVPYRLLRPLVHGVHLARVLATAASSAPCLLTTDPMTGRLRRRLLQVAARLTRRRLVVLLVAATPAQARAGQRQRGRVLGERRMTGHEQRYARLYGSARHGSSTAADGVLAREQATAVRSLDEALRAAGLTGSDAVDPGALAQRVLR